MTKSTITREQAQKIIVAADEVITALAGTNEDVHPDDSKKMCELWDDLNDRHAPPVVVRELARMALAAMDSEPVGSISIDRLLQLLYQFDGANECAASIGDQEYALECGDVASALRELLSCRSALPVADVVAWSNPNEERKCDIRWRRHDVEPGPLYRHAQPAQTVQPMMFIDGDISSEDTDKLAKVIREFNEEDERPLAKMARIIRENPHPTNECDMPKAQPAPELKPVGYLFVSDQGAIAYSPTDWGAPGFKLAGQIFGDIDVESQPAPVVPDERAAFNAWNNDVDCPLAGRDAKSAAWLAWQSRAAMLAAAPQSPGSEPATVPGKWIPVSEHLPKEKGVYQVWNGKYVDNVPFWFGSFQSLHSELITHWMPLPAAPQEVNHG